MEVGQHSHIHGSNIRCNMPSVELKQIVGQFCDPRGQVRRVGWDMDYLILDGRAIATINQQPGAPIKLYAGVALTPSEKTAVEKCLADSPRGEKPSKIVSDFELPGGLLDDEDDEGEETEVDGE